VILAGGLGTRLRPYTERVPKGMVSVLGKPFLQHQIVLLRSQGIEEILLLVGYLAEQISNFFGDGSAYGVNISYSREVLPLGTAGALKLAADKLHEKFLLLNGDTFLLMNYQNMIDCFLRLQPWGLVVGYKKDLVHTEANLAVLPNMQVVDSKGMQPTHINAGVMMFSTKILELIPGDRAYSIDHDLFPQMVAKESLWVYETEDRYFDMGTHDGLKELENFLDPPTGRLHVGSRSTQ
jgi:NDP-sugar pyrophosphorylase family protein